MPRGKSQVRDNRPYLTGICLNDTRSARQVGELLLCEGVKLSAGTIVDASLIAAPPSTNNRGQSLAPEVMNSNSLAKYVLFIVHVFHGA